MKTMGTPASPARGITSWFKGKQINGKEGGRGYTPIKRNMIKTKQKHQYAQGQAHPRGEEKNQKLGSEIQICNMLRHAAGLFSLAFFPAPFPPARLSSRWLLSSLGYFWAHYLLV